MSQGFRAFLSLLFILMLGMELPALGAIPPSQYLFRKLAAKHSLNKSARIRSTVTAVRSDGSAGVHFKEITIYDVQTRTLRSRAYDDSGAELYAVERQMDKSTVPSMLANDLLFESHSIKMIDRLRAHGVHIPIESELLAMKDEEARRAAEQEELKRWKGHFAWVVLGDSQVWLEKDTFLPLRLVLPSLGETDAVEIEFENYRFTREFPYPRMITLNLKSVPVLRDELGEITMDSDLSEFRRELTPGFSDAGNSADSEVRALIRQYYGLIR
jgi:hypothetical protein